MVPLYTIVLGKYEFDRTTIVVIVRSIGILISDENVHTALVDTSV